MTKKELNQPITQKFLLDFTNEIILPGIREIIEKANRKFTDEILDSHDKLSKKLDIILNEFQSPRL